MNVECAAMARLLVRDEQGERTFDLLDSPLVVGRAPEVKLMLSDKESSRRHCQLEKVDQGWKVVDLESRNGTRVNGKFVNQHLLRPGDAITIGKTTMTFEDPNWKAPEGDELLKYAAASAPVAAPPPPAAADNTPVSHPKPDVVEPAPKRTGHTTAVGRRSRVDAMESRNEAQTLKIVGVVVGLFIVIVIGLIVAGAVTGESPGMAAGRSKVEQARKLAETDPRAAINLLSTVGADGGKYFREAQELIEVCKGRIAQGVQTSSAEEEAAIRAISDLFDEAAGRAAYADRIIKACQDFKAKYPRSAFLSQADDFLARASESKTAVRGNAIDDMEREVTGLLKTNDYAAAWKAADAVYAKYKTDLDVRSKIEARIGEIIQKAESFYKEETTRAKVLHKSAPDEARKIYTELITKLGDGKVDAFKTQCQTAQLYLDNLKQ